LGLPSTSRHKERLLHSSPILGCNEPQGDGRLDLTMSVSWSPARSEAASSIFIISSGQFRPASEPDQKDNRGDAEGIAMKKPLLSIDEPEPKKATRADRPPTEGFATIVDGHFKSEFDTADAAEAAGRKLKSAYPYLQIEIYDSVMKVRTLLS
jgi:hypothetical protein